MTENRSDGRTTSAEARSLRGETPSTVALLADETDFAAMRRYATFAFDDHSVYLRRMEELLRSLAAQGVHITVALFDPAEFEEFCEDARLDPDSPRSRTRYIADVAAAGATVTYDGRPIDRLVHQLIDEAGRHATLEYAMVLLGGAGDCPDCGEDRGAASYSRASQALTRLLQALGTGEHHLVCSVPVDGTGLAAPLVAVLNAECRNDDLLHMLEAEALVFCGVLAASIATDSPGGVVVRSGSGAGSDAVRGWAVGDGWLQPLTAAEVFTAYCTDPETGQPVPPEPGVDHLPGIGLPPPEDGC